MMYKKNLKNKIEAVSIYIRKSIYFPNYKLSTDKIAKTFKIKMKNYIRNSNLDFKHTSFTKY